jgi:hypothetical protein
MEMADTGNQQPNESDLTSVIAAKTGWEGILDVLPPKAAGTLKQRLSPTAQRVMGQMNRTGSRDGRELGR